MTNWYSSNIQVSFYLSSQYKNWTPRIKIASSESLQVEKICNLYLQDRRRVERQKKIMACYYILTPLSKE